MSACVVPPWTSSTTHGAPSHAQRYLMSIVLPQPHSPISTTGIPQATRTWIASILSSASPVRQYPPPISFDAASRERSTPVRAESTSWWRALSCSSPSPILTALARRCESRCGWIVDSSAFGSRRECDAVGAHEKSTHAWSEAPAEAPAEAAPHHRRRRRRRRRRDPPGRHLRHRRRRRRPGWRRRRRRRRRRPRRGLRGGGLGGVRPVAAASASAAVPPLPGGGRGCCPPPVRTASRRPRARARCVCTSRPGWRPWRRGRPRCRYTAARSAISESRR